MFCKYMLGQLGKKRMYIYQGEYVKNREKHMANDAISLIGPIRGYRIPEEFVKTSRRSLFQIRNPLDIIVSQYFSHGFIHPHDQFSPRAIDVRESIRHGRISIFDYAVEAVSGEIGVFGKNLSTKMAMIDNMVKTMGNISIIQYETMVSQTDYYLELLSSFLGIPMSDEFFSQLFDTLASNADMAAERGIGQEPVLCDDPIKYIQEFLDKTNDDDRVDQGVRERHLRNMMPNDFQRFFTAAQSTKLMNLFSDCSVIYSTYVDKVA